MYKMYKPGHLLCPRSDNILVYQLCHLSWVLSSHSWLLWQSSLPISGSTCTCITPHERSFKTGHLCIAWTNSLYLEFFQALFLQVLLILCMQLQWTLVLFFSWHKMVHDNYNLQIVGAQSWDVPWMDQTPIMRGTGCFKNQFFTWL